MNKVIIVSLLHLVTVLAAKDFRKLVRDDITTGGGPERVSMKREYEIYSKVTGSRVQVRGRKVDANGSAGSKHATMEISSVSFGGLITIKGVAANRYICMSKKGKLITKRKSRGKSCQFAEAMGQNYFDTFTSLRRPEWFLAFQQNGRPKKGPKTAYGQAEVMFLTFLKEPKHKRALLSTSSPSLLADDAWKVLETRIRRQFLRSRKEISVFTGPSALLTTEPPEIRDELETRHQMLIKLSNRIPTKKKNRRRKNKKSKQRANTESVSTGTKSVSAGTKSVSAGTKSVSTGTKSVSAGTKSVSAHVSTPTMTILSPSNRGRLQRTKSRTRFPKNRRKKKRSRLT